jgi:hypothetical protein
MDLDEQRLPAAEKPGIFALFISYLLFLSRRNPGHSFLQNLDAPENTAYQFVNNIWISVSKPNRHSLQDRLFFAMPVCANMQTDILRMPRQCRRHRFHHHRPPDYRNRP